MTPLWNVLMFQAWLEKENKKNKLIKIAINTNMNKIPHCKQLVIDLSLLILILIINQYLTILMDEGLNLQRIKTSLIQCPMLCM